MGDSLLKLATPKEGRDYRAEAKAWASVLHDAEARKYAEEAAELILRKGFELPALKEVRLKRTRMGIVAARYFEPMSFEIGMGRIEVNTHPDVKKWAGGYAIDTSDGWNVQPNVILHEFGHMVDYYLEHLYPKTGKEQIHDRFNDLKEEDVKKILSKYGATQPVEFRAEMIAGILSGKSFPKEFLDAAYLDKYLADDRGKTIYQMGSGEVPNTSMVEKQFGSMMEALFHEEGASLRIELLEHPEVVKFTESHAQVMDNAFMQVEMSDTMRARLRESDYIFSGIKTFHELNEAFPSLLDENGHRKSFEQFLNDVRKIDDTYNRNYLNAEYNFAQASAEMAGKWESFRKDDDYLLQYRTQQDGKVRPEHATLHGITLPADDSFWDTYFPPNGWNCRCTVAQVRKEKYAQTDHDEAIRRAEVAITDEKSRTMFGFNPGKEQRTFPAYNPYTISKCTNCPQSELKLAAGIPANQLCEACIFLQRCVVKR